MNDYSRVKYSEDGKALVKCPNDWEGEFVVPKGVESIGEGAFKGCVSLKKIAMTDSVTGIAYCTFHGCESLKNIVIPSNVTHIEKYAFIDCKNLTEVHIGVEHLENLEVNECAFVGSPVKNCTLYVPNGAKKAYRMHKVFGEFGKIVEESRGNVDDNCEFLTKDDIFDLDSIPMDILDKGFQRYHPCDLNINRKNGINEKNQ